MNKDKIAYCLEHEQYYNLLLLLKDSTVPEEINKLQETLDKFGFWSPSEEMNSPYVTPFDPNRKIFQLISPENWKMGEFPVEGTYRLAKVWREDEKEWRLKVIDFSLRKDGAIIPSQYPNISFQQLLSGERDAHFHTGVLHPDYGKPSFDQTIAKEKKKEKAIIAACLKMAPELTHLTWPKKLQLEGKWDEVDQTHPDFFKKTFELIMSEPIVCYEQNLPFKSVQWENNAARITTIAKFKEVDENARRNYGIEDKVDAKEEIGFWLHKVDEGITFDVVIRESFDYFSKLSGQLNANKISIEIETPYTKKGKDKLVDYFATFGIEPVNLEDWQK